MTDNPFKGPCYNGKQLYHLAVDDRLRMVKDFDAEQCTAALYAAHIEALEAETRPIQLNVPRPNFAEAIKNKRTYASMQGALDDMLAQGKIAADAAATDVRAKLAWCKDNAAGMSFLFPDLEQIISKQMDDFTLLIQSRIKEHKEAEARKAAEIIAKIDAENAAKLEAERARMQQEEAFKAQATISAEVAAKVAAHETKMRAEAEKLGIDAAEQRAHEKALAGEPYVLQPAEAANNNPPQSQAGTLAGAQPEPAALAAKPSNVVVIEHQAEISAFLASRDFGKEAGKVRAILCEFVKFSEQFNSKKAA